jgi:hypothetical protein
VTVRLPDLSPRIPGRQRVYRQNVQGVTVREHTLHNARRHDTQKHEHMRTHAHTHMFPLLQ